MLKTAENLTLPNTGSTRHCPICGDEIPATAHRLKKLCGKPECLLEQQRISGRKSYHKLLGHTEPEKRLCVVCSADITGMRGNRVVCTDPACKREIKRRSGYTYFARNKDDPEVRRRYNANSQKYRAAKRASMPPKPPRPPKAPKPPRVLRPKKIRPGVIRVKKRPAPTRSIRPAEPEVPWTFKPVGVPGPAPQHTNLRLKG